MKICILAPRFPFPQFGGDALRLNEIARYLKSKGHTLILVSLSDEKSPSLDEAYRLYDKIFIQHRSRVMSYMNSMLYPCIGKPMQLGYYYSKSYLKLLQKVVKDEQPDIYVSHLLRMVPYLEKLGVQSKSIVEMTDALSKTYLLSSSAKGVGLLKYVYTVEQKYIERYEQYVIKRFPKVVLVSQADVDYLKEKAEGPAYCLAMHTNGVGVMDAIPEKYNPNKICFLGNMRSMQNQDAAIFFANEVFPLVKEKVSDAKFYIVGSLPPANIQSLASDDIIVTGFVDDLEAAISDSCLAVAPVRVAAGIQNKVLVAMGCGIPVVLTSLISKAIPELKDGDNCLVRDNARQIADACIELMNNASLRSDLSAQGYEMVKNHYSWNEKLNNYEII